MNSAVSFADVAYSYEGATMRFDLDVPAGEWLALVGPSGAGKSTLLDLAAGFITPDSGHIRLVGRDMDRIAPGDRPLSFVFQENNLFPHLSALQNVALGISTRKRLTEDEKAKSLAALADVGLAGLENRRPFEMSGGERQRVALARAFLRKRPVLLLDEPFAALGPAMRQDMLALLAALRKKLELTILMVTHHPADAVGFADRVAFLQAGRVAAIGSVAAMLGPPPHPLVASYLGNGVA